MIRSALRSVSYLAEDVGALVKWVVGEVVAELDYRLQPAHVREGWAAELADIEAGVDVHEPNAPYLQWGGPETWPQPEGQIEVRQHFGVDVDRILQNSPYCNRCGYPHPTTQACLRDQSSPVVPPTAGDHPGEVESGVSPHPETPSPGPDLPKYMAETDAVVAQLNAAEDRRLRLAMDVQAAVMEHCVLNPAHEPGDATPDWIDVAYALQRDYVITPRK